MEAYICNEFDSIHSGLNTARLKLISDPMMSIKHIPKSRLAPLNFGWIAVPFFHCKVDDDFFFVLKKRREPVKKLTLM